MTICYLIMEWHLEPEKQRAYVESGYNSVTILNTKQGQAALQRVAQRKRCCKSKPGPLLDIGFPPLDERGEGLIAGGDEGLKLICVAYGVSSMPLAWYCAEWIELAFVSGLGSVVMV